VKLYGPILPPSGPQEPELALWQQAELWATDEYRWEGPDEDPMLVLLVRGQRVATLTRQRIGELWEQWLDE
jgi:hypothetical protein